MANMEELAKSVNEAVDLFIGIGSVAFAVGLLYYIGQKLGGPAADYLTPIKDNWATAATVLVLAGVVTIIIPVIKGTRSVSSRAA